eukprot:361051-Chlamydomonas_euryale.AAC.7
MWTRRLGAHVRRARAVQSNTCPRFLRPQVPACRDACVSKVAANLRAQGDGFACCTAQRIEAQRSAEQRA